MYSIVGEILYGKTSTTIFSPVLIDNIFYNVMSMLIEIMDYVMLLLYVYIISCITTSIVVCLFVIQQCVLNTSVNAIMLLFYPKGF
jgi:hypothetical protein